jgi:hypothetical protein
MDIEMTGSHADAGDETCPHCGAPALAWPHRDDDGHTLECWRCALRDGGALRQWEQEYEAERRRRQEFINVVLKGLGER